MCSADYVDGFSRDGGILLFVSADRRTDGLTLADLGPAIAGAEERDEEPVVREWSPPDVPQQVQLVELLQFLQRPPFARRCRRLGVIVSAWDVVLEPKPAPDEWLAREMPLLHQFLMNNPESFCARVYGVSAQGGDVKGKGGKRLRGGRRASGLNAMGAVSIHMT